MKFTKLAAAATLALAAFAAQALPTSVGTNTFLVKIQITGTCLAGSFDGTAVGDIDFGTEVASATATDLADNSAGTTLQVLCSKNLPVEIALTPSNANAAGAGIMTGALASPQTIAYTLRKPNTTAIPFVAGTAASAAWGSGTNALSFKGNGLALANALTVPVAASIAAPALNVQEDSYEDTVTATLSY